MRPLHRWRARVVLGEISKAALLALLKTWNLAAAWRKRFVFARIWHPVVGGNINNGYGAWLVCEASLGAG